MPEEMRFYKWLWNIQEYETIRTSNALKIDIEKEPNPIKKTSKNSPWWIAHLRNFRTN